MSTTAIRPFFNAARVTVPTGVVVPDLGVKRSLVLDTWNAQRQAKRSEAIQRERLQIQSRAYAGAELGRLTGDWVAMNTSADSEILTSLRVLRARSRQLVRDNPYAKHAVRLIANNVIGSGMGMQAQVVNARGKLQTKVNDSIEKAYCDWSGKDTCHTAGLLSMAEIERVAVAQLVTSGEFIARKIRQPFGRRGEIPLALEVIEADRLLDVWQTARAPNGNAIRMGVEVDRWHRPVAYWFTPNHPGDYQFTTFEPARYIRVPAEDIIHLYIIDRWPMTRGEPWFHATLRDMHDTHGYEEAVIVKARASANVVGFIKAAEPMAADEIVKNRQIIDTEPGTWQRLLPGEDVTGYPSVTPDPAIAPFLSHMLRKQSVGVGIGYSSYSGDYTAATYSSVRMEKLDDRDHYRVLQGFVARNLRLDVHSEFMDAATLVGKVNTGPDYYTNPAKYQAVRFKPRGWTWIDPTKEVAAYKMAVRSGFTTQADVIAQTGNGMDIEDVLKQRRAELDMAGELELVFDTDPLQVNDKGQVQPAPAAAEGEAEGAAGDGSADASTGDDTKDETSDDAKGDDASTTDSGSKE